jgi:hypothetical protein
MATHLGSYLNLCTPKGRIVKGSTHELITSEWKWNPVTKRYEEKLLAADKHKKSITLALRKDNPAVTAMLQQMYLHARDIYKLYPDIVAAIDRLIVPKSGFAWKIYDGDLPNQNTGKTDANCVGCWLLQFDCYPPREFRTIAWNNQAIPPESVKTGYECDIAFSIIDNGLVQTVAGGTSSGIYLNAAFVRYLGTGEELVRGPSADQLMPAAQAPDMPAVTNPNAGGFASTAAPSAPPPVGFTVATPAQTVRPSEALPSFAPASTAGFTPPKLPDTAGAPVVPESGTSGHALSPDAQNGASALAVTVSPSDPVPGFATGDAV